VWKRQRQPLREDFRRRAIAAGTATALLVGLTLLAARREAIGFSSVSSARGRFSPRGSPRSRFRVGGLHAALPSRPLFAAGEITLMLIGWAVAHTVHPLSLCHHQSSAAPLSMLRFMILATSPARGPDPSLLLLFRVFKSAPLPIDSLLRTPAILDTGGLISCNAASAPLPADRLR